MEKHSESRLSYLFAHLHLLSSDLVSSDSSHLCFSTVHIVGSFTSKLPSISIYLYTKILVLTTNHLYSRNKIPSNEFELHLPLVSHKFPTPHPKRTQMIKLEQCLAWIAQNVSSTSNLFKKVTLSG